MDRCPTCEQRLPLDPERTGARCPSCRYPLFEPVGRVSRPAREEEASCAAHAGMESVGRCAKCGEHVCETCRTPWRGLIWCAQCVDKALGGDEATPEQERVTRAQARAALVLGVVPWAIAGAVLGLHRLAPRFGPNAAAAMTFAAAALIVAACLPACVAAGQALAALRMRERSGRAIAGLALGGLYTALVAAAGLFHAWRS